MSANEFKHLLFNAVLDLLWRQWSQLGVSGQVAAKKESYVLDPEALLIFSAGFCRYDQRLYDLILDWLRLNGSLVNIQRMKALAGQGRYKDTASLGYMAAQMQRRDANRWKKPAADYLPKTVEPVPMFRDRENECAAYCRNPEELALQYGFLRNEYIPSGKTVSIPVHGAASLLLRVRGLCGVSARAETVLILLDKDICKVQDIADLSGFVWKSIQDVLAEMSTAGFVAVCDGKKRGKQYVLKSPDKVKALLDAPDCRFPDWQRLFDSLGLLWETISNPRLTVLSEATFRSELDRIFEEEIRKNFLNAGLDDLHFPDAESLLHLPEILKNI